MDSSAVFRPNVILVEDNGILRRSLADYLRLRNMDVTEAASGTEFHALLPRARYDIAVLDVGLPDTSGFDLAASLAATGGMGVIMLTARARRDDRIEGYQRGADLYFTKPVDSEELAVAIANLARRARRSGTPAHALERPAEPPTPPRLVLDRQRHALQASPGTLVKLSARETLLLEYLALRPAVTVSRNDIADLFGRPSTSPDSRIIDAALARLRTRFRAAGLELPIQVVHNVGVRLSRQIDLA
jgi:DNA-binding response OmpR family regulator